MKKIYLLISLGLMLALSTNVYAGNQWRGGTGENTILGGESASNIDSASYQNIVAPLDRLNANSQEGCKIVYASASTITVQAGEITLSNSAGSIRLMQQNTSDTTVSWGDIDTGAEADSTTYYLWAFQETATDTDFDVTISTSSTAPSGKTYFLKLGSFYNDSNSNIVDDNTIVNDYETAAKQFGDWVSKSENVSYLASSDGFVCALGTGVTDKYIEILSNSANPPTIRRGYLTLVTASPKTGSVMSPVKKGDYYRVNSNLSLDVYWIPNE